MSLDPKLKLSLAKAARDLAAELEAGTAPTLGVGMLYNPDGTPCCAMGHIYERAGVKKVRHPEVENCFMLAEDALSPEAMYVSFPVENANDSLAPWLKDATASTRTPLPAALRDYALAVEGL